MLPTPINNKHWCVRRTNYFIFAVTQLAYLLFGIAKIVSWPNHHFFLQIPFASLLSVLLHFRGGTIIIHFVSERFVVEMFAGKFTVKFPLSIDCRSLASSSVDGEVTSSSTTYTVLNTVPSWGVEFFANLPSCEGRFVEYCGKLVPRERMVEGEDTGSELCNRVLSVWDVSFLAIHRLGNVKV